MQIITVIPIEGNVPELISEADFYTALNTPRSIDYKDKIITIKERQYQLNTLNVSSNGGAGYLFKDLFIPSVNGQTDFALSHTPTIGIIPLLTIGGQTQEYGTDYTITDTTLTWLNNDFQLSITDRIIIYYS